MLFTLESWVSKQVWWVSYLWSNPSVMLFTGWWSSHKQSLFHCYSRGQAFVAWWTISVHRLHRNREIQGEIWAECRGVQQSSGEAFKNCGQRNRYWRWVLKNRKERSFKKLLSFFPFSSVTDHTKWHRGLWVGAVGNKTVIQIKITNVEKNQLLNNCFASEK